MRVSSHRKRLALSLPLVLRDSSLPEGVSAFGLKNGSNVVFKVAAQLSREFSSFLIFNEIPATVTSKRVELDLLSRKASVFRFQIDGLSDSSSFNCQF